LSDSRQSWTLASGKKQTTLFEYHADGLLKKKTLPDGSFTQLAYDQKFKKVSSVTQNDRTIEYKYDPRGNLASAYDKYDNRKLDLTYDVSGRLTKVREAYFVGSNSQWRDVFFRYDGQGNPIEIKEKSQAGSEGIIRLSYSNSGEVTSVTNGKGRAISSESEVISARQVAATFQNLLDIIRPAGVTLTPEG
jgi:YD repeat-containing protein